MLTCQAYIFKLTSGQLAEATPVEKFWAFQHRLICHRCRTFTANDQRLSDIVYSYKQHLTSTDHAAKE